MIVRVQQKNESALEFFFQCPLQTTFTAEAGGTYALISSRSASCFSKAYRLLMRIFSVELVEAVTANPRDQQFAFCSCQIRQRVLNQCSIAPAVVICWLNKNLKVFLAGDTSLAYWLFHKRALVKHRRCFIQATFLRRHVTAFRCTPMSDDALLKHLYLVVLRLHAPMTSAHRHRNVMLDATHAHCSAVLVASLAARQRAAFSDFTGAAMCLPSRH